MEKVIISPYEESEKLVDQQIGISDYVEFLQERINLSADATLGHQWIHVNAGRAKINSPHHSTIVHGYLALSTFPYLWNQVTQTNNLEMIVDYGMDKMRFGQVVLSGQNVHLAITLHSLINLRDMAKAEIEFAIEIKDQPKKTPEGIAIFLYYFNQWQAVKETDFIPGNGRNTSQELDTKTFWVCFRRIASGDSSILLLP